MDDGAALLAAIAAHPDEDVPRLAYADWLDEHHLPIRAEFIRLQHEIKQIEDLPSADVQRYADLYRRQDYLLTHHRRDLLGPLGDDVTDAEMNSDIRFERGFLKELRLDAERFVKYAESIVELKPWPDVTVWEVQPDYSPLRRLPEAALALVTSLELELPALADLVVEDMELDRTTPTFPRLTSLHANNCGLGNTDLDAIVSGRTFPELYQLNLAANEITDDGVRLLVQSSLWPRLDFLVLDHNPISDEGAEILATAPPTALRFLNVRRTGIGPQGQQRLLRRKGWNVALF